MKKKTLKDSKAEHSSVDVKKKTLKDSKAEHSSVDVKKKTLEDFKAEHSSVDVKDLQKQLKVAQQQVRLLSEEQHKYRVQYDVQKAFKIGLSSDWHLGSLHANTEALVAFYEYAYKQKKVTQFFCAGDMLEGHNVYRGQEFELRDHGFDQQRAAFDVLADRLPKKTKTHFICGNHDTSFKKASGIAVGPALAANHSNFNHIGDDLANILIETPNGEVDVALMHPAGGSAYALSYKPQKILDGWRGGSKPTILAIGHYHKSEWIPSYRNVSVFQAGCFQNQTPFMRRGGLAAHVGGWILTIHCGELTNQITAEFISFY